MATGAQAASPSVDLTPNRPALYMVLDQFGSQRSALTWNKVALPLFRPDLTLNEPPEVRLTPRWIEEKGIKVQLVGEDVVVTMPFITKPKDWLANKLRRLAGIPRRRS